MQSSMAGCVSQCVNYKSCLLCYIVVDGGLHFAMYELYIIYCVFYSSRCTCRFAFYYCDDSRCLVVCLMLIVNVQISIRNNPAKFTGEQVFFVRKLIATWYHDT